MAISTNGTIITRLAGALYGEYLSNASYNELVSTAPATVAANFLTNDFAGKTDMQIANTILSNLGLTSITGLNNYVAGQLTAAGSSAAAKGAALVTMLNGYAGMTADATYGTYASSFNSKVAASLAASQTSGSVGGSFNKADVAAVKNETYALTTAVNALVAGAGNDTFDGSLSSSGTQTLNSLDNLNGGDGSDVLNAALSASVTPAGLKSIETINVSATAAATLGLINATDVAAVNVAGVTGGAFTLSGVSKSVAITISDSTQDHTISYKDVSGVADSVNLSVSNLTGVANVNVAGVESMTINSAGGAGSNSIDLQAASLTSLIITGSGDLTIAALDDGGGDADSNAISSINASSMNGKLTLTTGALNLGSQDLTITGGAGNDVIDASGHTGSDVSISGGAGSDTITVALAITDTISGGDGTDTLATSTAVSTAANVSGIEILKLTGNISQDMSFLAGNAFTRVQTSSTGTLGVTKAPASVTSVKLGDADTTAVSLARATDTAADALTVIGDWDDDGVDSIVTTATLTLNDEESLTIDSSVGAVAITTLNAADLTTLTITGLENLTIGTLAGNTNLATIDASNSTGAVSIGLTANNTDVAMTVTAGSGHTSVLGAEGNDTMTGGAGNDSLNGATGNDSLVGGAGNDTLIGGAGNDYLSGGDGEDTLQLDAGVDQVYGGAGNDTITASTNYATTDVIDGGDGTDTMTMGIAADITPGLTSIEVLTVDFDDSGADATPTVTMTGATSVTTINMTGLAAADVGLVASVASGTTVAIKDDDVVPSIDTVANAVLTISAAAASTRAVTVTDATSVTVRAGAASGALGSLALDAVDTTSVTVSAASVLGYDVNTGNITGTDKVATLSLSTVVDGGTAEIGTFVDASSLTSISATATGGNITIGAVGGTDQGDVLATISATATGGGDITFADIEADNSSNDVVDNSLTITASANGALGADVSSVTFGVVDNTYGNVTANLSGDSIVDFTTGTGSLVGVNITVSRSGAGATTIDLIDSNSGNVVVTKTGSGALTISDIDETTGTISVDGSASTGALNIDTDSANNVTVLGGSAADTLRVDGTTGTGKVHSVDGGAGNDTIYGGDGADKISGGDGADSIDAGAGADSILGGAGNDTFLFDTAGDLTSADTVDGGDGTDSMTLTIAASVAPVLTSVENIDLTTTGTRTLTLTSAALTSRVDVESGSSGTLTIAGMASGGTVRIFDGDTSLVAGTASGGAITIDSHLDTTGTVTIVDAASVTIKSSYVGASNAGDITALALDTLDTTSLTVTGGIDSDSDVDTGAITESNALATLVITSSTTGSNTDVASLTDADSLTSLTINADYGNVSVQGAIGDGGSAEGLSTISITATHGATATLSGITADTTDSTTDNAMTVTVSADSSSAVEMGAIVNTYGTISLNASGGGSISSNGAGTDKLSAVDVTLSISGGGGTYDEIEASDDVSITASNTAALTFDEIDFGTSSDDSLTVVASGSAAFLITTTSASAGSISVDGSLATGTVKVDASNASGNAVMTGGSNDDTLIGGTGNDSIVGGSGNDSLTGSGGSDTISGGEGNDTLILGGSGSASLDGGAGNDTFTLSTNYSSGDTIVGGDGTDTANITLGSTIAATMSGVEVVNATFNTGGALNAANLTGLTEVKLTAGTSTSATVTNLASGVLVTNTATEAETITIDTVANAALTVKLLDDASNALTITDAASVTINAAATAATAGVGSTVLDNTDTTTFTVTGATTAYALSTGTVTNTNAITTLTSSTSIASGAVTIGTFGDLGAMTSVTLTAANGDLTVSTGGDFGTASNGDEGEFLATINLTASGGATIDFADGQTIHADTITDSTTDLAMTVSVTNSGSSTINVGTIDNQYGTIIISAANNNAALTFDGLTASSVTATVGGTGSANLGTITTSTTDGTGVATIDASAMSGALTVNLTGVAATATVTTGQGGVAGITTSNGATKTTNITLGAANQATDQIVMNGTAVGTINITNFNAGATNGDAIDLSIVGIQGRNLASGADDFVSLGDASVSIATSDTLSVTTATGALDLGTVSSHEILILSGDFATSDLVETAIEVGGSRELTFNGAIDAATDVGVIVWDDGSSSYMGILSFTNNIADNGTIVAGEAIVTTIVTFVGVQDATTLTAANLGTSFIS